MQIDTGCIPQAVVIRGREKYMYWCRFTEDKSSNNKTEETKSKISAVKKKHMLYKCGPQYTVCTYLVATFAHCGCVCANYTAKRFSDSGGVVVSW